MKVCILSKYPPIEGGVSTCNYWLAKALVEKNHKVFVVTNAEEVEFEYREEILPKDAKQLEPKNIKVFNTYPLNRRFIPQYPPFIAKLASLAIDVIKKEKIDVLYSNYLMPYGVAAYIAKQATGVPWFLDHAGSDITNLFDEPFLQPVFIELFRKADLVVNSPQVRDRLLKLGIIKEDKLSPFLGKMFYTQIIGRDFSPRVKPLNLAPYFSKFNSKLPVFTYLGKISPLKKTFAFVEAASLLSKGRFYLLFVTERGRMLIELRNVLRKYNLLEHSCLLPFQPPWRIPSIITVSTCVVAPESEEAPYLPEGTHGSKVCLEAMLCGRCAVIGKGMSKKAFYSQCKDKKHFLIVDPHNIKNFAKKLNLIVGNPSLAYNIGRRARKLMESKMHLFQNAVDIFIRNLQFTILKKQ